VTRSALKRLKRITGQIVDESLGADYFRTRDFEYVQPLYDLAFLLEVDALAKNVEVPKYRTFSLWRAGYSLDGYGTTIDCWLDGTSQDRDLDYVPSSRIRQYLTQIRSTGTVPELRSFRSAPFERCLRLRSVRGLGPSTIALTIPLDGRLRSSSTNVFGQGSAQPTLYRDHAWQSDHDLGIPGYSCIDQTKL
jgi:hypothetical protein